MIGYKLKNSVYKTFLSPVLIIATAARPSAPNNWLTLTNYNSTAVTAQWSGDDSTISTVPLTGFAL